MNKVAIFGGTFNPVHNEHVALAKQVVEQLGLDRLIIMPTFLPPHKNSIPAPASDRLNMLKLAFEGYDKIEVSDYEIQKQGKSYTFETVEHFKSVVDGNLYFIVGADMLADFKNWRNPMRILNACDLVAVGREDTNVCFDSERQYFIDTFGKPFIKLSYTGKTQSSTAVRVYSSLGLDITDKVPISVANYIEDNGLYAPDKYCEFVKKTLTEKRLIHTAEVTITALSKAKELKLDSEKVRISALLHDCAKYIDHNTVKGFMLDSDVPSPVVHAFLGEYVAKTRLGIDDCEILDAIKYHTSGKPDMSDLAKLIFVADMVEKGRNYQGVEILREYFKGDLHKCFVECLKEEMVHLINKKSYIYRLTLEAYDFYVKDGKGEN